ncbi:MAG: type IV secretory system conjugative DNA transfer family protein [Pseudonocardia sp.]
MNLSTVAVLLGACAGSWLAWRAYARPLALGLAAFAVLPAVTLAKQMTWPIAVSLAGLVGAVVWHRWARTSATVTRWGSRIRRKSGVASSLDIARFASARAMRAKAATVRPSLAGWSRWQRWRMPATEVAVPLCRVGFQRVWSSIEDVTLVFGGPRVGKSGWMAGRIIDAPGAALVTSTRTDLYQLTSGLRAERGPVWVFNAVGLGELASTITFNPLTGCADPVTATERATDMLAATVHHGGAGGGDRAYWEGQARRVLAALLHAAALAELSIRDVLDWVADPDGARDHLTSILRRSPEPGYVDEVRQFIATNDRTRTSITSTVMPALNWLTSPAAAAAASGVHPFDVAELLDSRATVYLLGAEEAHTAPLVCALTGHIAREARRIASRRPGGRLDPPLSLWLDEAALISPIPLHQWSADMGGRGVLMVPAFQSRAQLIDRYGDAKAAVILNNASSKVLFGGTGDRDDLTFWSTLAGERDEPITTTDLHGRVASRTVRKVPVLAPAQLANLPAGRVVAFRRGMPPVIGRAQMAWQRPDVRAQLHPRAVQVRVRAALVGVPGAVAGWVAHPVRSTARGFAITAGWVRDRAAALGQALAAAWAVVAGWFGTRPDRARPEPATQERSAEIVPFPTTHWPAEPSTPAALPSGDWPHDNGAGNDPGRWN